MKAIQINGSIRIFTQLPEKWEQYRNFIKANPQLVYELGFRDVVTPTYDLATQKLGFIFFDEGADVFTYPVLEKTPEEIAAYEEQQLNSDVSQQEIDRRRADGITGYNQIMAIIERKYRAGEITGAQAISAVAYFDNLTEALNRGGWIICQSKMNSATVPTGYQPLFTEIKNKVDSYIEGNYA